MLVKIRGYYLSTSQEHFSFSPSVTSSMKTDKNVRDTSHKTALHYSCVGLNIFSTPEYHPDDVVMCMNDATGAICKELRGSRITRYILLY